MVDIVELGLGASDGYVEEVVFGDFGEVKERGEEEVDSFPLETFGLMDRRESDTSVGRGETLEEVLDVGAGRASFIDDGDCF